MFCCVTVLCLCHLIFSTEIHMGLYNKGENYSFLIKVRKTCFPYLLFVDTFNAHMKKFCLLFKWQRCGHKGEAGPKVRAIAWDLELNWHFPPAADFGGIVGQITFVL